MSDPTNLALAEKFGIQPEDVEELEQQGYRIQEHVVLQEQGSTRRIVRTKYKRGLVEREVVIKFPIDVDPLDSINSFINTQRRDLNASEARIHKKIGFHSRIAPIFGTIPTRDGRTIIIEPIGERGYDVAPSLERDVANHSPIRDLERAKKFIDQFLEPCLFLARKSIVHRDIKPSNVLMTDDGPVLTDAQNATYQYGIESKYYPTKGGTSFSAPELINGIIEGQIGEYQEQHEVYSIGTTILYALTGQEFGYHLDLDPKGTDPHSKPIKVSTNQGEQTFHLKLSANGEDLEEITRKEHEKRARKIIRELDPVIRRRYGKTLEQCVIPWHKKAIKNRYELADKIKKINSSSFVRLRERFIQGAGWVLPTATGVGIGGAIAALTTLAIVYHPPQEPPTIQEILDPRNQYGTFCLEELTEPDKEFVYSVLVPYMRQAQKKSTILFDEEMEKKVMHEVDFFFYRTHRMDKRLTSAWLRSCFLNRNLVEAYGREESGQSKRLDLTFVPRKFARMNSGEYIDYPPDDALKYYHGIQYLKLNLGSEQTAEETIVGYFTDSITKNTAIARSGSLTYLPRVEDHTIKSGFHEYLPYHEQELINTALALYMMTDDEGKVHYDWIPRVVHRGRLGTTQSVTILEDVHEKRKQTSIAPVKKSK